MDYEYPHVYVDENVKQGFAMAMLAGIKKFMIAKNHINRKTSEIKKQESFKTDLLGSAQQTVIADISVYKEFKVDRSLGSSIPGSGPKAATIRK